MRKELGLTQSQLAEMAEMSARSLSDYEKGHRDIMKINIVTACKLAKALGYGMDDFVEALYSQNE